MGREGKKNSGRKTHDPSGEAMKLRSMRWTDAGWASVLYLGAARVRAIVIDEALRMKKRDGKK